MALTDLGSIPSVTAAPDQTGQNTGNLTTVIGPQQWLTKMAKFTVWHMVLESLPLGAQAKISRESRTFGGFGPATGTQREWWGNLPMNQTETLYFYWNLASGTTPVPVVTCWLAYDPVLVTLGLQ